MCIPSSKFIVAIMNQGEFTQLYMGYQQLYIGHRKASVLYT